MNPVLQMVKQRLREAKHLAQGHTARTLMPASGFTSHALAFFSLGFPNGHQLGSHGSPRTQERPSPHLRSVERSCPSWSLGCCPHHLQFVHLPGICMLLTLSLQAYTAPSQDPTSHWESLPSYQALPSWPCFPEPARLSTSSLCTGPLTNGFMSGSPVFPLVPDAHQALSGLWGAPPPDRLYVWLRQLHLHITASPSPHLADTQSV